MTRAASDLQFFSMGVATAFRATRCGFHSASISALELRGSLMVMVRGVVDPAQPGVVAVHCDGFHTQALELLISTSLPNSRRSRAA
jgi:hypothetical protein